MSEEFPKWCSIKMFLPVLGHLKLGNGDKVWLVPGTTVTLGRQHVRIHPAAAAVARCQCEVSASHGGVVHATSKGTNPTAVWSPAGQRLLRQGVCLCCLKCPLSTAQLQCIAFSAPLVHPGKAHGKKCHLGYWRIALTTALFTLRRERRAVPQRQAAAAGGRRC